MSQNPLQQYFRQPKIFVDLPSHGVYNEPGSFQGSVENIPIFGMTGMDEILLKTPDALLVGESIVKVVESCCPIVKNGWDVSILDINTLLIAIKIASSGPTFSISHTCPHCNHDNDYDIVLSELIDDYKTKTYNGRLTVDDLIINTRPLNYRQSTDMSLANFQLQQKLKQIVNIESETERSIELSNIFKELGLLQVEIYTCIIESIKTKNTTVIEKQFIKEWLQNTDADKLDLIKDHLQSNQDSWGAPKKTVLCDNCHKENIVIVEMDQANFFGRT